MTGLVTGHCHIKAHLFKLGPANSPSVTDVNRLPEQKPAQNNDRVGNRTLSYKSTFV